MRSADRIAISIKIGQRLDPLPNLFDDPGCEGAVLMARRAIWLSRTPRTDSAIHPLPPGTRSRLNFRSAKNSEQRTHLPLAPLVPLGESSLCEAVTHWLALRRSAFPRRTHAALLRFVRVSERLAYRSHSLGERDIQRRLSQRSFPNVR